MLPSTSLPRSELNLRAQGFSQDLLRHCDSSRLELSQIASVLSAIGILDPGDRLIGYEDLSPWHRGGAETFISEFEISFHTLLGEVGTAKIVAKAIVAWGRTPDLVASDWESRQDLLRGGEISTPRYYGYWKGIFLQQHIPFLFVEYLHGLDDHRRGILLSKLQVLAERVDRLGFQPISLVEDLRTDGVEVYIVDFGEDLGGISECPQPRAAKLVASWAKRCLPVEVGVRE